MVPTVWTTSFCSFSFRVRTVKVPCSKNIYNNQQMGRQTNRQTDPETDIQAVGTVKAGQGWSA